MVTLQWVKCEDEAWCSLEHVDLANVWDVGVYVIWHSGPPPNIVRVGQGDIASRLQAHRNDQAILNFRAFGELLVTWAAAPPDQVDGIERYLVGYYRPLIADRYPDVRAIAVNLP